MLILTHLFCRLSLATPSLGSTNQFRQYVYDVTDMLASPSESDNNITVAFESAYFYGLNVISLPGTEVPLTSDVSTHASGAARVFK